MSAPKIDYSSRDFSAIRSDLLKSIPLLTQQWTDFNADDVGVTIIELFAYMGDMLNVYLDRLANESYLSTAVSHQSIRELVKLLGYQLRPLTAAFGEVEVRCPSASVGDSLPEGFSVRTESGVRFEQYGPALFAEWHPYFNAAEYDQPEPYGAGWTSGNKTIQFTINGTTLSLDFSGVTGHPTGMSASDMAWFMNASAGAPSALTGVTWRAWCSTYTAATASVASKDNVLVDTTADFKSYMVGCYVVKGNFTSSTYEGVIEEVIDSHTIRTSPDTRTAYAGDDPDWEEGDAWAIKLVPARVFYSGGLGYLFIQGTNALKTDLVLTEGSAPLTGLGYQEASPLTISKYVAVRSLYVNGTSRDKETLGTSSGAAFQQYRLSMDNLIWLEGLGGAREGWDLVVEVDEGAGYVEWEGVEGFGNSGYADRHYRVSVTTSGKTWVCFGDGSRGRIPAQGAAIRASYRVGGGETGNQAPLAVSALLSTAPFGDLDTSVRNHAPMFGGQSRESLLSAKSNAPQALRTLDRAVTAEDYEFLAGQFPGVAVAKCAPIAGSAAIHVLFIPESWDGLATGWGGLKTALAQYLGNRCVVGSRYVLRLPTTVDIYVTYNLVVRKGYDKDGVAAAVAEVIEEYLSPVRKNTDTDTYYQSIGEDVYLDELIDQVRAVDGVKYFEVVGFEDDPTPTLNASISITYSATTGEVRNFGGATALSVTYE